MEYDAKQVQFLEDDRKRLQRALDAAGGELSMLRDGRRSDHHLLIVLGETIADLRKQVADYQAKEADHGM
jgi:hypothetical protein